MKKTISFDSSPSMRSKDENGFLRIAASHITKECVNPYYGREVPDWQKQGLDPEKIYFGYRSGEELKKAAPTFDGLPLLLGHHIESADDPQKEHRVGSTGSDTRWNAPYLDNSLFVTDARAIQAIEDESAKELSCAYMYDPDFTPGEWQGIPYDFVMRNIRGNHVALVEEGRAGPDVVVADAQIETPKNSTLETLMKTFFDRFKGATDGSPEIEKTEVDLAQAIIDLHKTDPKTGEIVDIVEDEDKAAKVRQLVEMASASMTPEQKKQFADTLRDLAYSKPTGESEVAEKVDQTETEQGEDEEPMTPAEAVAYGEKVEREREEREEIPGGKDEEFETPEAVKYGEEEERDRLMREHMKQAADACGMDAESEVFQKAFAEGVKYGERKEKEEPEHLDRLHESEGMKKAMDEDEVKAAMDSAIASAKAETMKHFRALNSAVNDVRSILGNVDPLAFDSADDIYGAALKKNGVDITKHPKSAYRSMFAVMGKFTKTATVAQDSAPATGNYEGPFAGLNRINH